MQSEDTGCGRCCFPYEELCCGKNPCCVPLCCAPTKEQVICSVPDEKENEEEEKEEELEEIVEPLVERPRKRDFCCGYAPYIEPKDDEEEEIEESYSGHKQEWKNKAVVQDSFERMTTMVVEAAPIAKEVKHEFEHESPHQDGFGEPFQSKALAGIQKDISLVKVCSYLLFCFWLFKR